MDHKNIVVIGGTKGIGRSVTEKLKSSGHKLTVFARHSDSTLPSDINFIKKDFVTESVTEDELPEVIDGLVYCPGSINLKPFKSITDQQFLDEYQINVLGAVKIIRASLKGLKKSVKSPSIVLFSTVAVSQGMPFHASIAMAKGAVEGLTRSLAAELAPGIRVNCIAPSLTNTPLSERLLSTPERVDAASSRHPLKRVGQPEDIASMAVFLLSDESTWISGQILAVDGGMSTLKI
ncbi:MAG: SDR family oxidoreductase [Saprospiraceae bacterium]|nr:SDR family oxidoreductase [Saprospiraceae bacterium]